MLGLEPPVLMWPVLSLCERIVSSFSDTFRARECLMSYYLRSTPCTVKSMLNSRPHSLWKTARHSLLKWPRLWDFWVHIDRETRQWAKMSVVWINGEDWRKGAAVVREQNIWWGKQEEGTVRDKQLKEMGEMKGGVGGIKIGLKHPEAKMYKCEWKRIVKNIAAVSCIPLVLSPLWIYFSVPFPHSFCCSGLNMRMNSPRGLSSRVPEIHILMKLSGQISLNATRGKNETNIELTVNVFECRVESAVFCQSKCCRTVN